MLGVPLMIMGAAKQAVAKKIDKRARGDLKKAMGNVAGAMGGGAGAPAFARTKYKSSTVDRSWKTAIKNAEQRRRDKKKFSNKEQMPTAPSKPIPPHDSPKKRVKSDLPVNEIDLSVKPTGGKNNSPNALEIGLKKAKEKAEESDGITRPRAFYRMKPFPKLKEVPEGNKGLPNLPEEVRNKMGFKRMNDNMEIETLTPVNRTALQMTGRKGDEIPMMRSYGTPYTKRSATGKAKIKKTVYGQTWKAILDKNLIQPVYKKIYKDKNA